MKSEARQSISNGNRRILNFYWAIAGFMIIAGQFTYYIADRPSSWMLGGYLNPNILVIGASLISILLLVELLYKYTNHLFDYVLITIGFLFAIVIMLVAGKSVSGLQIGLEIPILVSMIYFNSKKLWFAVVLTLIGYITLYIFIDSIRIQVSPYELIAIAGMIIGTGLVGHAVRIRGMELLQSLERAVSSRREQFVDTITMEYTSKQDHLTGLYNHITFHEYLDIIIQHFEVNGLPLQLAIVDIDNFKHINDTYGHLQGDEVLRRISSQLNDSITNDDFMARYGGEEFALIMTGKTQEKSLQIVEGIRVDVANLDFPELEHLSVTVSIGLTEYVKGQSKDSLFQKADALLYQAKLQGKNMTMSDYNLETLHGH